MLTKTDLSQIRKIIREEVEAESKPLREDLQGEIKLARIEIQNDIRGLTERAKNLEIATNKIQKDIKSVVDFFDKEHLELRKRVKHLEEHQNLPSVQ
jgi:DNA replication protein DnaD